MANNRLYMRCMVCGKTILIGKSFLTGFYVPHYREKPLEETLDKFYRKHAYCTEGDLFQEVTSDGLYELVYEHADNEYMKEIE